MYRPIQLTIYYVFFGCYFSCAQSTDSLIKSIRSKYQSIRNNVKTYDTIVREVWDESAEGGQITGYYKKNDLKLIEAAYFGETGKKEIEYYFENGLLFFAFEKNYTYNRPIYWDKKQAQENNDTAMFDPEKTVIAEARYYFHKGNLIRLLDNENMEVNVSAKTRISVARELLSHAQELRDKLKK